jgi:hypothetical protein
MGKANSHTWDAEAEADLLKAMNVHFRPNAEDCKKLVPILHAKGYSFSDNALLYDLLPSFAFPLPLFLIAPNLFRRIPPSLVHQHNTPTSHDDIHNGSSPPEVEC